MVSLGPNPDLYVNLCGEMGIQLSKPDLLTWKGQRKELLRNVLTDVDI